MITRMRHFATAAPVLQPGGPRLLYIDDDRDEMVLLRDLLARTGRPYDLVWSHSYEAGLEQLRTGGIAVALVDHRLGGRTGLDLVRQATSEGCRVPMIMLTSDRDPWVDHSASELGAVDFLVKGESTPSELERTVRYAIAQGHAIEAVLQSRERIAVLEQIGHELGQAGPVPETLQAIVAMVEARLGRSYVSIYLADGDVFRLGASVGYREAVSVIYSSGQIEGVVRSRRPAFVSNQAASAESRGEGIGTELCIPLLEGSAAVGLLLVGSPETNHIGEFEHSFFVAMADRIGAALTLSHDRLDLGIRRKRFRRLRTFAAWLAATDDRESLRSSLAAEAATAVGAERAHIGVPGQAAGQWITFAAHGHPDRVPGGAFAFDLAEEEAVAGYKHRATGADSRSQSEPKVVVVPIVRGERVIGVLRLERLTEPFDHLAREAATLIANGMSLVLEDRAPGA